jgi:hypothetical protein
MELTLQPLPAEKPSNRGKFSPDRDYWEKLHQARYTKWQLGETFEVIAEQEGVTINAIRHSISWCEARLPNAQVLAGRATRLRLQTIARLADRYIKEVERLMDDPNPIIRSRALEHFRKTVGIEGGAGVQVNVNTAAIAVSDRPKTFEQAMDAVKRRHVDSRDTESVLD